MMSSENIIPRILLISQWPNVKNGEFELIEKIKQTSYKITVVDYFGFDVDTGICLNNADIGDDYDFAISFHYDTPKFLNIPTYLWVANPLEFMHLRGDYRNVLIHHLRSYDDYLYNGSDTLKTHIKNIVGSEWRDSGLEMFPACARKEIAAPRISNKNKDTTNKIFYCGVNWERGIDRAGRAQGLLDILQEKQASDFYGPDKLEGISPWEGFTSYKGEIPFDGVSMSRAMQDYGAVLAVSSPAHMKSHTSSSRVFEGIAAGVPVISDENAHVRHLFGDLVYYFKGDNEEEKAASILQALSDIINNPDDARDRVTRAQKLMDTRFCFEASYDRVMDKINHQRKAKVTSTLSASEQIDIFLFHHDPDTLASGCGNDFHNASYVIKAASFVAKTRGAQVRIICCGDNTSIDLLREKLPENVKIIQFKSEELTSGNWDRLRLGEKVALLSKKADADITVFFTQFDFPHFDYFSKSATWFADNKANCNNGLYLTGYFVNDLSQKAALGTVGIMRNNTPNAMYRWTQNSLAEHQLAMITFSRESLCLLNDEQVSRFDAILPVALIALAKSKDFCVYRSRHILLRVQCGYFSRHYEAYTRAAAKGFWSQHYDLVTNYNHELNALYDQLHESAIGIEIADKVSGHNFSSIAPIDPAIHVVNQFIGRLRPIYRWLKKFVIFSVFQDEKIKI